MKNIEINEKEFRYINFDKHDLLHVFSCENDTYYVSAKTIKEAKKELLASYIAKQAAKEIAEYKEDMYLAKVCFFENDIYHEVRIGDLRIENLSENGFVTNALHPRYFNESQMKKGILCLYKAGKCVAQKTL